MTPISEKDTIYEQTHKASLSSVLKIGEESKKSILQTDDRKITGTGKYAFQNIQDETYGDEEFYEEDFEDVNLLSLIHIQYESDFEDYEEDENEKTVRDQRNQFELAQVVSNYQRILESSLSSSSSLLSDSFRSTNQSMSFTGQKTK